MTYDKITIELTNYKKEFWNLMMKEYLHHLIILKVLDYIQQQLLQKNPVNGLQELWLISEINKNI